MVYNEGAAACAMGIEARGTKKATINTSTLALISQRERLDINPDPP
jgi:hypothetical protein